MDADTASSTTTSLTPEHVDVLIVGAGISGIGGAYHLTRQCPGTSFVVLEALASFGGTWLTHRFPGIRSDSDLYTFGYSFKPWPGTPIASAPAILRYMGEVIEENDLARHIRYRHRIDKARWSSETNLWTIDGTRTDSGEPVQFTAGFLWMCQGYYRHSEGYTPAWPGMDDFNGPIVHTQTWPEDLDYSGKNVVVIGSGATAATIVPAMAADCAHVTMLQRSPTFFATQHDGVVLANELRGLQIDEAWIHAILRKKIVRDEYEFISRCRTEPETVRQQLLDGIRGYVGPDYDVEAHFSPRYRPWQQRLAYVPDGDLFKAIAAGKASVVTDQIDRFTTDGILLASGKCLDADIIVTATGFHLSALGDIAFTVDGTPLDFAETVTYHGMMFTGLPNMAWVFGYFRHSWTLRADLVADFVCRLLSHMKEKGAKRVVPVLREADKDMTLLPWIDPENFNPGYLARGLHLLPKRGDKQEWQHTQDYWNEKDRFPAIDLDDGVLVYG